MENRSECAQKDIVTSSTLGKPDQCFCHGNELSHNKYMHLSSVFICIFRNYSQEENELRFYDLFDHCHKHNGLSIEYVY